MTNKLGVESLSSLSSGVNLSQVPPIHQKRLLTFVNHFIITTVSFLNKFAQTCESKLVACDKKMQRLEANLCILEAKLNSIPGLENVTAAKVPAVQVTAASIDVTDKPISDSVHVTIKPPSDSVNTQESTTGETQAAESESSTPPAAKNPELARFFKMLQFGVPAPAVKLKMQQEGFDPSLLDS